MQLCQLKVQKCLHNSYNQLFALLERPPLNHSMAIHTSLYCLYRARKTDIYDNCRNYTPIKQDNLCLQELLNCFLIQTVSLPVAYSFRTQPLCVPTMQVIHLSGHCSQFIPVESHGFAIRFSQLQVKPPPNIRTDLTGFPKIQTSRMFSLPGTYM